MRRRSSLPSLTWRGLTLACAAILVTLARGCRTLQRTASTDFSGDWQRQADVIRENTQRLAAIVDQIGCPADAMVGRDGAWAAWAIAQHARALPQLPSADADPIYGWLQLLVDRQWPGLSRVLFDRRLDRIRHGAEWQKLVAAPQFRQRGAAVNVEIPR